jgi:hypothetical protein
MIIMLASAALAAAQPAAAPAANNQMPQHDMHQQMAGHSSDGKDCCRDCCKDMAAKHEGQTPAKWIMAPGN